MTHDPSLPLGTRVGEYRIDGLLGRGGEADVYLASVPDGEPIALKIFRGVERLDSALREGRAMAALRHPHILPVIGVGRAGDRLFVALRYAPGGSLHARITRNGPMGERAAAACMVGIADALALAHEARVVHRDVHPRNLLFDAEDRLCLADFGLSSSLDAGERSVVGVPRVIAPEIWTGGAARAAADAYAFGACLHFAATGRDLVSGMLEIDTQRDRHLAGQLDFDPRLSPAFRRIVVWLTRLNPDERLTMREAVDALAGFARHAPGGSATSIRDWTMMGLRFHLLGRIRYVLRSVTRALMRSPTAVIAGADDVWRLALEYALSDTLVGVDERLESIDSVGATVRTDRVDALLVHVRSRWGSAQIASWRRLRASAPQLPIVLITAPHLARTVAECVLIRPIAFQRPRRDQIEAWLSTAPPRIDGQSVQLTCSARRRLADGLRDGRPVGAWLRRASARSGSLSIDGDHLEAADAESRAAGEPTTRMERRT